MKNEMQIFGNFCGSVHGDKFGFRGALCAGRLCVRTISHNDTSQATSVARRRTTLTQFVGMRCIHMSNQLSKM